MAGPTEEDLQKIRDDNDKLREQIAAEDAKRAEREAEATLAVSLAQLSTENARLQAQLASAKEAAKVATVKAGTDTLMTSLKDNLETAVAQGEAPVGPVDTNADQTKKDGGNS
jgi:hypothetical protein